MPGIVREKVDLRGLTGLRAIASWWVVLFHLRPAVLELTPENGFIEQFAKNGGLGVDLFFVLSGFVLALNYGARAFSGWREYLRFLQLRLARIYPVHVATLLIWVGFVLLNRVLQHKPAEAMAGFTVGSFAANLALIHAWGVPIQMSWNYPAWSISMEWLAYLGFPVLSAVCRTGLTGGRAGIAAIGVLIAVQRLGLWWPDGAHHVRLFGEFFSGCLLYITWREWRRPALLSSAIIWGSSIALAVLSVRAEFDQALPLFGVLVLGVAVDTGVLARFLGSRFLVYWGKVSFSLYMVHAAVISACHVAMPIAAHQNGTFMHRHVVVAAYLLALGLSGMALYHFVEEPLRQRIRRKLAGGRGSVSVAGTA